MLDGRGSVTGYDTVAGSGHRAAARDGGPRHAAGARSATTLWLATLLLLAAGPRLAGLFHDLPYSFYGDELHLVKRAMAMGTGDPNPHWFSKPAGLLYMLLFLFGLFYLAGAAVGSFASPEAFGAWFLADQGAFLLLGRLLVFAFGLAAVLFTYLFCRRALKSRGAAFAVAAVVAFLPPMVSGAQYVKEDLPSAAFALAGLWVLLVARERDRCGWWFAAGALFGLSTATKFYGLLFLPAALAWILASAVAGHLRGPRDAVVPLVAGFATAVFLATPYTFLDPTFRSDLAVRISTFLAGDLPAYDPDNGVSFVYGPAALPGALDHVLSLALEPVVFGPLLLPLAGVGAVALPLRRRNDGLGWLLFPPILSFLALAGTLYAYHPSPRHFTSILPLLACLAWFGALALVGPLARRFDRPASPLAAGLLLLALAPNAVDAVERTRELAKLDSRVVSASWIRANLPPTDRILLDDYGPVLPLSARAAGRQLRRLEAFPPGEAFTAFQRERLELLRRHPADPGFDIDELGHAWWSPREASEEEIRADPRQRRFASPLKLYEPPSLAALRARGYRWVVTNELAAGRYRGATAARDFPSYVRFYRELAALPVVARFDPADWGGKGPVVTVLGVPRSAGREVGSGPVQPSPPTL